MMAPGAFGAPPAPAPTLSAEQVLAALQEVDVLLAQESSMEQLNAARAAAGTDPMMAMMMVRRWQDKPVSRGRRRMLETEDASLLRAWRVPGAFQQPPTLSKRRSHREQVLPLASQLLAPVLSKYGFSADQGGLFAFVAAGFAHQGNEEIVRLAKSMRERVVPPELVRPSVTFGPGDETCPADCCHDAPSLSCP